MKIWILVFAIVFVCPMTAALAQPPFSPNEIPMAAPKPDLTYRGPAIGISVDSNYSVRRNGVLYSGVRVKGLNKNRSLYSNNGSGGWGRYRFSVGNDLITHVNGNSVHTPTEVLQSTYEGWNVLKIYDMRRGSYRDYVVYLQ